MRSWMTNRHEGCVSTMLTDKRLEYCTTIAPLQGSGATKWRMQADKHGISGVFRLDIARAPTKLSYARYELAVICYSSYQQPSQWSPPLLPPRPPRC